MELLCCLIASCHSSTSPAALSSHQQTIRILQDLSKFHKNVRNPFNPETSMAHCDSMLQLTHNEHNKYILAEKAPLLIKSGHEQESVDMVEELIKTMDRPAIDKVKPDLSLGRMNPDTSIGVFANKCFANTPKGFSNLFIWVDKMMTGDTKVTFVMEVTGIFTFVDF
jgi:hypothetical protein